MLLLFQLLCSLIFYFSACRYQHNLVIFLYHHQPLEVREHKSPPHKVAVLGIWVKNQAQGEAITELATALESGRYESVWFYFSISYGQRFWINQVPPRIHCVQK